jgi:hypothetical protein
MKYGVCLSVIFSLFCHVGSVYAQTYSQNIVGCYIVNEGYFLKQPSLIKGKSVVLDKDSSKSSAIFISDFLNVRITPVATQRERQTSFVSAFRLIVQPLDSKMEKQYLAVKSSVRSEEGETIGASLTISSADSSKTLSVDCSSRE